MHEESDSPNPPGYFLFKCPTCGWRLGIAVIALAAEAGAALSGMSETSQTEEENKQTPTDEEGKQEETGEEQPETPAILPDPVHPATISFGDYITFGNFVNLLTKVLGEEATITVDRTGAHLSQMSNDHVSLVQVEIPAEATAFSYDSDEPSTVGFRIADFKSILARVSKTDDVVFSILDRDNATLTLRGNRDRTFLIYLIESTFKPAPAPAVTLTQKMVFVKNTLLDVLKDANAVSAGITVAVASQQVRFSAKSDAGAYEQVFTQGKDIELIELLNTGPMNMAYGVGYLVPVLEVLKDIHSVALFLDNHAPLRAEMSLSSLMAKAKVLFWLAPRVSEEPKPEPQMEPDEAPVNDEEPQDTEETQGSEDEPSQEEPVPAQ